MEPVRQQLDALDGETIAKLIQYPWQLDEDEVSLIIRRLRHSASFEELAAATEKAAATEPEEEWASFGVTIPESDSEWEVM